MNYRQLGRTGLSVSEIGLGAEWLQQHNAAEIKAVVERCESYGINILDCFMLSPMCVPISGGYCGPPREMDQQGHSARLAEREYPAYPEVGLVKKAFDDLLHRLQTDYIDLGMVHFVDEIAEYDLIMNGDLIEFVKEMKRSGTVRHIGLSTHNPVVARMAAESGGMEVILFSLNPAFDMLPASEDIEQLFNPRFTEEMRGIAPEREEMYRTCEREGVGLTVMKVYAGGRLFNAERSPFGAALTPVQCLHYALTRPAVASVLVGCQTPEEVDAAVAYETATEEEKDYASVLANAPRHAFSGQCTYCGHCAPCPSL
jgi:predicted aldo/keto reductase-like oxidoreductase